MNLGDTVPAGALPGRRTLLALTFGALGLVYGDIGTSPLYALRECFSEAHGLDVTRTNVIGVLSLVFWSLVVVIGLKYMAWIMRADNRGEGGSLALTALVLRSLGRASPGVRGTVVAVGLLGAALLYGDGIVTPAISVLSAVDGLSVASGEAKPFVEPITLVLLVALFAVQKRITGAIRTLLGPVLLLWFLVIAVLGVVSIASTPDVLVALGPHHATRFLMQNGWTGFYVLAAVFLVVTGGEALHADLGHFGRNPIRLGWLTVAFPALLLNYFGQGALLLREPTAAEHPFFRLAPTWALVPLVVLAAAAALIASQAMISAAFALTRQAVQLGYLPRVTILHTSWKHAGHVYVPLVNWALMAGSCALVILFDTPGHLAAAYGVGMATSMVVTTLLVAFVARWRWRWSRSSVVFIAGTFLLVDLTFWIANLPKIVHGGWVPLAVGLATFAILTTWERGRALVSAAVGERAFPMAEFVADVAKHPPLRVPGTAVFMSGSDEGTPPALLHNIKNNRCLHETVVLVTVTNEEIPHVLGADRVELRTIAPGFFRVKVRYGFTDSPNIPHALELCKPLGLDLTSAKTTFFLGHDEFVPTRTPGLAYWRKGLFAFMTRNAQQATAFFKIPAGRVVEIGGQVEL